MEHIPRDEIDWSKMLEEDWQILLKEMKGDELNDELRIVDLSPKSKLFPTKELLDLGLSLREGDISAQGPKDSEKKRETDLQELKDRLEETVRQLDRQKVLMQRQKQYTERLERWTHQMQGMVCGMDSRITALEAGNAWPKISDNFEDFLTGTLGNESEGYLGQLERMSEKVGAELE